MILSQGCSISSLCSPEMERSHNEVGTEKDVEDVLISNEVLTLPIIEDKVGYVKICKPAIKIP